MKKLFIVLVALNLGYLLVQALSATPSGAETVKPADTSIERTDSVASTTADVGKQPSIDFEPAADSASTAIAAADNSADDSGVAALQQAAAPVVRPAVDPAAVAPAQLVATSDSPTRQAAAKQPAPKEPAAEPAQMIASCVIAGPFRRRSDGEALIKQLANAGIDGELERRDTRILPDYMVYVGPEASVAKARSLEATFRARDMDSHLISDGELRNALSLGVFSRGPLARSLQAQLRSEGYKAQIAELTRNRRGYQVQTRLPQLIRARLVEADTPMIDCPEALATASR